MKLYIDFDGVIVDTWPIIVEKYFCKYSTISVEEEKLRILFNECNWDEILKKSKKNYKNIDVLKKIKSFDVTILTKVNSTSEKIAKENFFNNNSLNINIKTVNIDSKKSDVVNARNSILIDDEIKNLKDWKESGGVGILYSKNNNNMDSDGILNEEFPVIFELDYEYCIDLLTR